MQLTGTELLDWIALRRVCEGGVAMFGSEPVDQGRRVPCFLPEVFGRLADTELTALLDSDYPGGPRRVVLTPCGRVRYQELDAERGVSLYPDQVNDAAWSDRETATGERHRSCPGGSFDGFSWLAEP